MNLSLPDVYTDDLCRISTPGRRSTVTVVIGGKVFQTTASQWALMCRAYLDLETQAPGVPGHNTQEENAK